MQGESHSSLIPVVKSENLVKWRWIQMKFIPNLVPIPVESYLNFGTNGLVVHELGISQAQQVTSASEMTQPRPPMPSRLRPSHLLIGPEISLSSNLWCWMTMSTDLVPFRVSKPMKNPQENQCVAKEHYSQHFKPDLRGPCSLCQPMGQHLIKISHGPLSVKANQSIHGNTIWPV